MSPEFVAKRDDFSCNFCRAKGHRSVKKQSEKSRPIAWQETSLHDPDNQQFYKNNKVDEESSKAYIDISSCTTLTKSKQLPLKLNWNESDYVILEGYDDGEI